MLAGSEGAIYTVKTLPKIQHLQLTVYVASAGLESAVCLN